MTAPRGNRRQSSEPHARRPTVPRGGVHEGGGWRLRVLPPGPRRRGVSELLRSPKHGCLGGRPPELGLLGKGPPQPTLHLMLQSGGAPRQDLEVLPLERHREEPDRAPEHALWRSRRSRSFRRRPNRAAPPVRKVRVPPALGADHRWDQLEGRVGGRPPGVVPGEPPAPGLLHESAVGTTVPILRVLHRPPGGVRHVDLEVT